MRLTVETFDDQIAMVRISAKLIEHYTNELDLLTKRLIDLGLNERMIHVTLKISRGGNSDSFEVTIHFDINHCDKSHKVKVRSIWGVKNLEDSPNDWLYHDFVSAWSKYLLEKIEE